MACHLFPFFFSFFFSLPSFCFVAAVSSVIRPVCVTCVDLMRCLLCSPTLLNRRPHTLLCLSYKKWGKTHPVCFQREMQCVGRKDRLGIPTAAGWMMSSHPHLTSLVVFPHVERPTVHAHICTHKHILIIRTNSREKFAFPAKMLCGCCNAEAVC